MQPRSYRVVVEGELDDRFADAFPDMALHREEGNTVVQGIVRDQAQLQGMLQRIAGLGLTLCSLQTVDGDGSPG